MRLLAVLSLAGIAVGTALVPLAPAFAAQDTPAPQAAPQASPEVSNADRALIALYEEYWRWQVEQSGAT